MLLGLGTLSLVGPLAAQQTLGMVADAQSGGVVVFDADSAAVLGTVDLPLPGSPCLGDVALTADLTLGFVTTLQGSLWVIDVASTPPRLAAGVNPIPISNPGEDIAISPDQKYLLACGGLAHQPVSVIDIALRTEVDTFALDGADFNAVETCPDGSVLVTSANTSQVRRLLLDGAGGLSDTGESLFLGGGSPGGPNNVACVPGGSFGLVITRDLAKLRSFTIPGLALVEEFNLDEQFGISVVAHPTGDRVYTRLNGGFFGWCYDPATGRFECSPLFETDAAFSTPCFGVDNVAVHPDGAKLFLTMNGGIRVLDSTSGEELGTIPASGELTGIALAQAAECFLVVGRALGTEPFEAGGHQWPTHLGEIETSYPVTLQSIPAFEIPVERRHAAAGRRLRRVGGNRDRSRIRRAVVPVERLAVQVVMWNPTVFPQNPEQWTPALDVTLWSDGRATARPHGSADGMSITLETWSVDERHYVRFPFGIDGFGE